MLELFPGMVSNKKTRRPKIILNKWCFTKDHLFFKVGTTILNSLWLPGEKKRLTLFDRGLIGCWRPRPVQVKYTSHMYPVVRQVWHYCFKHFKGLWCLAQHTWKLFFGKKHTPHIFGTATFSHVHYACFHFSETHTQMSIHHMSPSLTLVFPTSFEGHL